MIKVDFSKPNMGMDVEFFWKKDNKIVESKSVLGDKPVKDHEGRNSFIVNDGIQGEINPKESTCRETLSRNVLGCIKTISRLGDSTFASNITVDDDTFKNISDESKVFGCKPSFDTYNDGKASSISVSGSETKQRTAGGHIHMSYDFFRMECKSSKVPQACIDCGAPCREEGTHISKEYRLDPNIIALIGEVDIKGIHNLKEKATSIDPAIWKKMTGSLTESYDVNSTHITFSNITKALVTPEITIPLLDLFCGIPSVLIDRSEDALLRRKLYGKAGEYRKPGYGLEYRTLSNFWIKSYQMMSLFTGLARHALLFAAKAMEKPEILDEMYSFITRAEIAHAINTNSFELARDAYLKVERFIVESVPDGYINNFPISERTKLAFKKMILSDYRDGDNVLNNWNDNSSSGFETWVVDNFQPDDTTAKRFKEMSV